MNKTRNAIGLSIVLFLTLIACVQQPEAVISELESKPIASVNSSFEFQKGVAYTSWWKGEYSSQASDSTIEEAIKPLGANWISVVVTCYQKNEKSTEIRCKPDSKTPTNDDLVHVINFIHDQGIKVMLKPHVNISHDDQTWRGQIGFQDDEAAWQAWFESYTEFITHYANLAQENQVDYFVVGTELGKTSHRTDQWRTVIKEVRNLYNGPLTYAANWDEVFEVDWWDDLDAIGVDAYFPLTNKAEPTIAELKEAWEPIVFHLGQLSRRWDLNIILTEIGYRSIDGTNQRAYAATQDLNINLQEQADCYQAVFEAFSGQDWWEGVFWWNWSTDPNQGGPKDGDFTAHNKPAENVLRENYGASLRDLSYSNP